MPLTPATRLGTYEIVCPLGAGGMGEVYRAKDLRLGREIALKVLPETFARDANHLARFEREARVVAALNHPNIVVLHSIEEANGTRFLTMELVQGQSLDTHVVPGGLPIARVVELGAALADALAAAHEKGVVHRDLKPANVGDHTRALVLYHDALSSLEAVGDHPEIARVYCEMGWNALAGADTRAAQDAFVRAVHEYDVVGSPRGSALALMGLAAVDAAEGRSERAVAIASAAHALSERAGVVVAHPMDPGVASRIEALKASIPKVTLEGLVANASTLSPAAVLAMVAR